MSLIELHTETALTKRDNKRLKFSEMYR